VREPIATRSLFDGRYVQVVGETWSDDGEYEVIRQMSAAAVLPLTPDDRVLLIRQFRPPIRQDLVEIPAGLLDIEGEDALSCAERELIEETGFRAARTAFLGGVFASAGSTDHYVHLFVARTEPEPIGDREPGIELVVRPFAEMVAAAGAGRIRDAKTALALLLAASRPSLP
jgi:ADP-ribose pyrophosphatase